jgi:hypothetical protein
MTADSQGSSLYVLRYYARIRLISTAASGDYDTMLEYVSNTSTTLKRLGGDKHA